MRRPVLSLCIALLLAPASCGGKKPEPTRWDRPAGGSSASPPTAATASGAPGTTTAPAPPPIAASAAAGVARMVDGQAMLAFFPDKGMDETTDKVPKPTKPGYAEVSYRKLKDDIVTLVATDTSAMPAVRADYAASADKAGGYPLKTSGYFKASVLVGDRYQVACTAPKIKIDGCKRWFDKMNLSGLAGLKLAGRAMQIDFHHGVTFVLARIAGFSSAEAHRVAYCSQYVDDSIVTGSIRFTNGAVYNRISSAHRAFDYRNFEDLASHVVWIPFHFLPGNMGLSAGEDPDGPFIQKLICIPNSAVAKDMIRSCIAERARPYGLQRLGITMHVYADTWAHQGFAGVNHLVNHASQLTGPDGKSDDLLANRVKNYFVNSALPLGHGTVLSNPDKPYLVWAYTNGLGERITRNNPDDYLDAAENMCRAMQCYRAGDADLEAPGLPAADYAVLQSLLREVTHETGAERHATWCYQVEQGAFSFGPDTPSYIGEGEGSWEHQALGPAVDKDLYRFTPAYLTSDFKRFHDALQAHRFDIINHILPAYGICAA